jgi:hypothetical protein
MSAQKFEVTGQIKDADSNEPLVYSYVHALNESDSLMSACITDDNGYFKVPLDKGKYKFSFSQLGYTKDTTETFYINENQFLDVFKIMQNTNKLEEITVEANSHKNYFNKDEQIITSELKAGAAGSYDVLNKVQGLHYDHYNDKITVDNDENIIILVNNVEKSTDYVKSIAPERMKKVEIIRSPSGKYALEGYSAVLNIVLKDNYKGIDVSVRNQAMMNLLEENKSFVDINRGNASLNFTSNKVNTYYNFGIVYRNFKIPNTRKRYLSDGETLFYLPPDGNEKNININKRTYRNTAGADFFISPKHTISYEVSYNTTPLNNEAYTHSVINENNGTTGTWTSDIVNRSGSSTLNNSVFYIGKLNQRNQLNMNYTYSLHKTETQNYIEENAIQITELTNNSGNYSVFNAEFNHAFNEQLKFDLGYGNTINKQSNLFFNGTTDTELSQTEFQYSDLRNQAYTYLTYKPFSKLTLKGGLAAEQSTVEFDNTNVQFTTWLPHADISYKPIKMVSATLKYRSESNYPSINEINPFSTYGDVQLISTGNPNLKPEAENTLSVRINGMGGMVSAEPYYTFTDNLIINVISQTSEDVWLSSYQNAGQYVKKGVKANLTIPFGKSFIWQNSADFYWEDITYKGENRDLNDWNCSSTLVYQHKKSKTTAGFVYQNHLVKELSWEGYDYSYNDYWAVMVQKPFFKEQLNVMLFYMLPIDFMASFEQGSYFNTGFYEETNNADISILKNLLLFRVTYRFSKGKEFKRIEKNIEIDNTEGGGGLF